MKRRVLFAVAAWHVLAVLGMTLLAGTPADADDADIRPVPPQWKNQAVEAGRGGVNGPDIVAWEWKYERPAPRESVLGVVTIEIPYRDDIYPDSNGVSFWIEPVEGGVFYSRTDKRGPRRFGDVFHCKERSYRAGDKVQAQWTSVTGKGHTAVVELESYVT